MSTREKIKKLEQILGCEINIKNEKNFIKHIQRQKNTADSRIEKAKQRIKQIEKRLKELTNA